MEHTHQEGIEAIVFIELLPKFGRLWKENNNTNTKLKQQQKEQQQTVKAIVRGMETNIIPDINQLDRWKIDKSIQLVCLS